MSKEIEKELLGEELDLGAETEDLVPDSVDMTEPLKIYLKEIGRGPPPSAGGETVGIQQRKNWNLADRSQKEIQKHDERWRKQICVWWLQWQSIMPEKECSLWI